jgi:hypothetical protein
MMPETKRNAFINFFVPRYDELSLFLTSLSFFLVYFLNRDLNAALYKFLVTEFDPRLFSIYGVLLYLLYGALLSVYHVFKTNEKTDTEKFFMLYFAVLANGLIGIMAGAYMLKGSHGLLAVFPVWNILNSLLFLFLYRFGIINETAIADDNAKSYQVAAGMAVIVFIFLICQYVFQFHWTITFSTCACYCTNVNTFVQSLLPKPRDNS